MTTLEIILLAIVWIGYGIYNGNQMAETAITEDDITVCYVVSILFCPLLIPFRMIWGIFSSKLW